MAAAFIERAPGKQSLGFPPFMAGRGGRSRFLGFTDVVAAAVGERGAPGTKPLGFNASLAGRGDCKPGLDFTAAPAVAV
jgi:hypothetical protein